MMTPEQSYIICTSPRSGGTLLCTLLTDTGLAGAPESLFYLPEVEDWARRLGVPSEGRDARAHLSAIFEAAIRRGQNGTPVFALRQQRHSFAFLCNRLAALHPEEPGDRARIVRVFGPVRFVHLTRADKVAQAVSFIRARQSGLWHVAADGTDYERLPPEGAPAYDAGLIRDWAKTFAGYDRDWNDWFAGQGITPIRIGYDALSAAPGVVLRGLLADLGLDTGAADRVRPGLRKMADATTEAWIARFRAETA